MSLDTAGMESGQFLSRMRYYHFLMDIIGKRDKQTALYRLLYLVEDYSLALQRKLGVDRINYNFYKGSSWFTITHAAASMAVAQRKRILKRFRFGANTDESWLQTFLMEAGFGDKLAGHNMRHIKWVQGNPSPEILTVADYNDLCGSEMLFARKFDWNKDREIIFKLKEKISEE